MTSHARRAAVPFLALAAITALAAALGSCSADIETPTNRYAVVIGVQDYPGTANDLSFPDDDAIEMSAILEARSWQVVSLLVSSFATYSAIRSAIQTTLANFIGADDNSSILVYYSGHGRKGSGYLVPYDAVTYEITGYTPPPDNDPIYNYIDHPEAFISPSTLTSWLDALPCKNKLLILDSCYSGNFVAAGDSIDSSPQDSNTSSGTREDGLIETAVANLSELIAASLEGSGAPSVLAISAAGSADLSYETGSVSNGVFTYYLLKAATSGDANGDGYVTATEAYAYAKSCIKAYWNSVYASSYEAFLPHISGGTGDLVLYVNK